MTLRPPQAEVPPVLAELRLATAEMHKAVERKTPFFDPAFDRMAYVRWLDVMHPFYAAVDAAVRESGFGRASGWDYRPRCGLIETDLMHLATRGPAEVRGSIGLLQPVAALRTVGEVAGMLYVIEGSSLGGQVLLKVLGRAAGVTASAGASFFSPHGDDPRPRWGAYIELLGRSCTDSGSVQDAVRGATVAFSVLGLWIDEAWSRAGR